MGIIDSRRGVGELICTMLICCSGYLMLLNTITQRQGKPKTLQSRKNTELNI